MTTATWTTLGVLSSLILGGVTLYFLARTNARENKRQQQISLDKAVLDATTPLLDKIAERGREIAVMQARNDYQQQRIDRLEDELRRGATP